MDRGLEICIDSLSSAVNAVEEGASQLEVCSSLSLGGLTPTVGLVKAIRSRYPDIPLMCMIRSRSGNFVYSEYEIETMKYDLDALRAAGATGFVFGFLNRDFTLDVPTCKQFIELAKEATCTLHRAFDFTPDWQMTLDLAVHLGFEAILTSGQRPTAPEGVDILREIVAYAGDRIRIMVGSGVNTTTLPFLKTETGAKWFHGSASIVLENTLPHAPFPMGSADTDTIKETDKEEVKKMYDIVMG